MQVELAFTSGNDILISDGCYTCKLGLLDVESVRATFGELFTSTVDSSPNEAPDAYKSFDFIRAHITPTAEIVARLVPLYNFKG